MTKILLGLVLNQVRKYSWNSLQRFGKSKGRKINLFFIKLSPLPLNFSSWVIDISFLLSKHVIWVYLEPNKEFYVSPSYFFNAWIFGGVGSIAASKA